MKMMIEKIKSWIKIPDFYYDRNDLIEAIITDKLFFKELAWKKRHPVKYFILKTIPENFFKIKNKINNFIWELKYTCIPKYKYHLLRLDKAGTSYKKGWIDSDIQIVLANFLILKNYVENELYCLHKVNSLSEIIEILKLEDNEFAKREINNLLIIKEIYDYWENRSKTFFNIEESIDESKHFVKDTEMLCKLITIRQNLWT